MNRADLYLALLVAAIVTAAFAAVLIPATRGAFPLSSQEDSHEYAQDHDRRP